MAKKSLINLITGSENSEGQEKENMADEETQEEWTESEGNLTVDVYQDKDDIVIKSTIAGVDPDDLDVTITNDMVTIQGERRENESVGADDYYYQELYWGAFSRSVVLPQEIDADNAKAKLENGVLTIRLPKLERSKTKKLKIS